MFPDWQCNPIRGIIVIVSQLNILLIAGFIACCFIERLFFVQNRKRANQFDIEKTPLERKICITEAFSANTTKEIRVNNLVEWLSGKYTLVLHGYFKRAIKIVKTRAKAEYTNSFFNTLQTVLILLHWLSNMPQRL